MNDYAADVATDSEDNFVVVGSVLIDAATDHYNWVVRKYQSEGSLMWETEYDLAAGADQALYVDVDSEDNIIVSGYRTNAAPAGDNDWYIVKYAKNGDGSGGATVLWEQSWDDGQSKHGNGYGLIVDRKDNIYIIGVQQQDSVDPAYTDRYRPVLQYRDGRTGALLALQNIHLDATVNNRPDIEHDLLRKTALNGNQLVIGGTTQQDGDYTVIRGRTGRVLMLELLPEVGTEKWQKLYYSTLQNYSAFNAVDFISSDTLLASGDKPAMSIRYNAETGDTLDTNSVEWIQYGTTYTNDYFLSQVIDTNGDIYMAGRKDVDNPVVWKYDVAGILQSGWPKIYADGSSGRNHGIAMDDTGFIYSAGVYDSNWHINKRAKSDGAIVAGFPLSYDHQSLADSALDIATDSEGNFIVVGYVGVDAAIDHNDWHVRKFSSDGTLIWQTSYDLNDLNDAAYDVVVDSDGNIIVSGARNNGTDNTDGADYDWYIVKYAKAGDGSGGATVLWEQSWDDGHARSGMARRLLIDNSDNIYVGGYQNNSTDEARPFVQYRDGQTGLLLKSTQISHPVMTGSAIAEHDYINALAVNGSKLVVAGHVTQTTGPSSYVRTAFISLLDLEYTVRVNITGEGTLSSTGTPAGIVEVTDCDTNCMAVYKAGSDVLLEPEISLANWTEGRWEWAGACTGENNDCNLIMNEDKTADLSFLCTLITIQPPAAPIDSQVPAWECFDLETTAAGFAVGDGGEAIFRAGNSIKLSPGFNVDLGGHFRALIE